MAAHSKKIINWPNLFSFLRIAATGLVVWLILQNLLVSAAIVFGITCWTDWADGFLARWLDQHSKFGQLLDPIADKIFLTGTFVALGFIDYIPFGVIVLVIARDILLLGGGVIVTFMKLPVSLKPIMISKLNTVLQMLLVVVVLGFQTPASMSIHSPGFLEKVLLLLVYGVIVTTVLSGGAYGWLSAVQLMRGKKT